MRDFLTTSQFDNILMFKVILGIFIVYMMYRFAVRNPTDFDTLYRRRMRYVYGAICAAGAIGFILLACTGPFKFSLPWYYLSTYGTINPSVDALQHDVYSNMIVRPVGAHCILGKMTFEQWALSSYISGVLEWTALAVYAFAMKRSSVKWFAKARKVIGYILLITFPAQINGLHFFDVYELLPLGLYILVIYLLVRTYKLDNKVPEMPIESQHENVLEFAAEHPEEVVEIEQKEDKKEPLKRKTALKGKFASVFKRKDIVLWVLCGIFFVASIVFAILSFHAYNHADDYKNGFNYYDSWGVYLKGKWVPDGYRYADFNIGEPVHPQSSLLYQEFSKTGSVYYVYDYAQPIYVRFLNYYAADYHGKNLFRHLHDLDYVPGVKAYGNGRTQIVYWDIINNVDIQYKYQGHTFYANRWLRKHIYEERDGFVYEFIVYMVNEDIYDESIEDIYSLDCPYEKQPVSSNTWMTWYCVLAFLTIVMLLIAILFTSMKAKENVKNIHAYRLLKYMMWCLFAEYTIHLIVVLFNLPINGGDFDGVIGFIVAFVVYLGLVRIPAFVYVYRRIDKDAETYYLFPDWLKRIVDIYARTGATKRAMLVFLIYPLFYVCTLPAGIFALCYIIPIAIIFTLIYTILWIFKEHKPQILSTQSNTDLESNDSVSVKEKLQTLKGLLNDGLITQEDYDKKKDEILKNFS